MILILPSPKCQCYISNRLEDSEIRIQPIPLEIHLIETILNLHSFGLKVLETANTVGIGLD